MAEWSRETHKLAKGHGWRARPGYNVFVADRGAVRFDIPRDWVVAPGDDSIRFTDKPPPDDDCLLQLSVLHLSPLIDWTGAPTVDFLLEQVVDGGSRQILRRGKLVKERRPGFELAWIELRVVDPGELREAVSRMCLARGGLVQPLITMDSWPEHETRFAPVWDEVLRTLRLNQYVQDPTRGPLLH